LVARILEVLQKFGLSLKDLEFLLLIRLLLGQPAALLPYATLAWIAGLSFFVRRGLYIACKFPVKSLYSFT